MSWSTGQGPPRGGMTRMPMVREMCALSSFVGERRKPDEAAGGRCHQRFVALQEEEKTGVTTFGRYAPTISSAKAGSCRDKSFASLPWGWGRTLEELFSDDGRTPAATAKTRADGSANMPRAVVRIVEADSTLRGSTPGSAMSSFRVPAKGSPCKIYGTMPIMSRFGLQRQQAKVRRTQSGLARISRARHGGLPIGGVR